jgi:branched-chain amino acid transport system substrate-binding protein
MMENQKMKTKIVPVFIILIFLNLSPAFSQEVSSEEINKQFDSTLALFNSGNFEEALVAFNKISTDYKYNSKTTAALFFEARIYLELKQLDRLKITAEQFLEKYPGSRYVDEMRMLLIYYHIEVANYYNAFRESLFIIGETKFPEYEIKAKKAGEGIAAKYLNEIQLERLNSSFSSDKVKSFVLLQIGKYHIRSGNTVKAKNTFEEIMKNYPESDEYSEARQLIDFSYSAQPSSAVIGVMLPLDTNPAGGYNSQPAAEILEGIKFAVNDFNEQRNDKIGLLIRDTKRDEDEIRKIREEFTRLGSLVAVIGPIFSNEVRTTLDEFEDFDIPIISPTATDDELTEMSDYFFQANPSFATRGRLMAQYIFYVENKRNLSILNSSEAYAPILAESFAEEFEELGGTILKWETFRNNSTNFNEQLSRIYEDSLMIEGLYVPLSDNSVTPYIFSGLISFNFLIPLYGNQDWFTAKGFETAPGFSNSLVFTSDYFVDFNSGVYQNFNREFNIVTGRDVNRNTLYGFDAAKYLLTAIRNSEPGRKNLFNKITSGMVSMGLHNNISFDQKRINKYLNIVRYRDGVFELVDKFRVSW